MSAIASSPTQVTTAPSDAGRRSPCLFFALVFLLSIPFALLGFVTKLQLVPGIPISALGFVCPASAAIILSYREHGRAGISALFEDLLNSSDLSGARGSSRSCSSCPALRSSPTP